MARDSKGETVGVGDWVTVEYFGNETQSQTRAIARIVALKETVKATSARGAFIDADGSRTVINFDPVTSELVMRKDGGDAGK